MITKRINGTFHVLSLGDETVLAKVFWMFTFALLTAIGAQIELPLQPVPLTMQTFFVLLSGAILGKRAGAISLGLYVVLGCLGLPVFSGGASGLAKIIGPTGGYLLAFPIAAFVVGILTNIRRDYWWMVFSMFLGSLCIFFLGVIQLNFLYMHNWTNSLQAGFFIFSWWDAVKIFGAATIAHQYFSKIKNV